MGLDYLKTQTVKFPCIHFYVYCILVNKVVGKQPVFGLG